MINAMAIDDLAQGITTSAATIMTSWSRPEYPALCTKGITWLCKCCSKETCFTFCCGRFYDFQNRIFIRIETTNICTKAKIFQSRWLFRSSMSSRANQTWYLVCCGGVCQAKTRRTSMHFPKSIFIQDPTFDTNLWHSPLESRIRFLSLNTTLFSNILSIWGGKHLFPVIDQIRSFRVDTMMPGYVCFFVFWLSQTRFSFFSGMKTVLVWLLTEFTGFRL